ALISRAPMVEDGRVAHIVLIANQPQRYSNSVSFPEQEPYSQPYWLEQSKDGWMYSVPDPRQIGDPENPPVLQARLKLRIGAPDIEYTRPVDHRYIDHIYGEMTRPLAVVPLVAVSFTPPALLFPAPDTRRIEIPIRSNAGKNSGDVQLKVPDGW